MRVCSICGERNEDWMDICQRCGNSIVNANKVEYKAARSQPQPQPPVNNINTYKPVKEKRPVENMDLKIILVISLLILIGLFIYTISVK